MGSSRVASHHGIPGVRRAEESLGTADPVVTGAGQDVRASGAADDCPPAQE
jgi:hypothetical protein